MNPIEEKLREIRFRAWDKEEKAMIDGALQLAAGFKQFQVGFGFDLQAAIADRYILMQFTGLRDKHGKEIYEGDILHYESNKLGKQSAVVIWDKAGHLGWSMEHPKGSIMSIERNPKDREIIGNIYENSELLQEPSS